MAIEFFGDSLDDTGLSCDYATVYDQFFAWIDDSNTSVFVADEGGVIQGAIVGQVAPWFFNNNILMLIERCWFVPERYRSNKSLGGRLFLALKRWGKEMGATVLLLASTVRDESDSVCAFYERIGVRLVDKNYVGRM